MRKPRRVRRIVRLLDNLLIQVLAVLALLVIGVVGEAVLLAVYLYRDLLFFTGGVVFAGVLFEGARTNQRERAQE